MLDRELVQRVADLGGQERLVAADLGEAVRVLDEADVDALLVAGDRCGMARDRARLAGEDRLRLRLAFRGDRVPAARARGRVEQRADDRDRGHGLDDVDPPERRLGDDRRRGLRGVPVAPGAELG